MPKAQTKAKSIPQYKQRAARYARLKLIENAIQSELKSLKKSQADDFKKHGKVEQVKDKHGKVKFDSRGNPIERYTIEINSLGIEKVVMTTEWKEEEHRSFTIPAGEKTTIRKTPQMTDEIQALIEQVLDF